MIKGLFCSVSEYKGNNNLSYCKMDAQVLKAVFAETFLLDENNFQILAENGEIENTAYYVALDEFCKESQENDLLVVYYSGHGGIDENGYNYLWATNTFDYEETRIYLDVIIDKLKTSKSKSKLVILDCCHADSKCGTEWQKFDVNKAVDQLYQMGIAAFFACKSNEISGPYDNLKISAFTQFLCDAIKYKNLYREDGLYVNDIKLMVDAYARVWNRKHPNQIQTPILRSNMIGTIVFPLKHPQKSYKKCKYMIQTKWFSIYDLEWIIKRPLGEYQKIYDAKVIVNTEIENNTILLLKDIINYIRQIKLPIKTDKQMITAMQEVDSVHLSVYTDLLDFEMKNPIYMARWDRGKELYWCNGLGKNKIQSGHYAYITLSGYQKQRTNRIKYSLPDEQVKAFWIKNISDLVIRTEYVISEFCKYESEEILFQDLKRTAGEIFVKLETSYGEAFKMWYPMPGSNLMGFCQQSSELSADLQEIIYLINQSNDEKFIKDNLTLKIAAYYQNLNRWQDSVNIL